ncbi:OPT-domain-containing protein [Cylindrobasidium torrendii FP15055 ss-10]|uniref:OPT-domain-containing protein n=1 Tax=Cylindrobasidium torrendii FP15055 ss-10 TaxID=1314674 RepID=A0A0D7B7X5_9AGAR|nr:OPT-domain-containing protein [Cylindrobasidium torrendii FP15055 ss-10]
MSDEKFDEKKHVAGSPEPVVHDNGSSIDEKHFSAEVADVGDDVNALAADVEQAMAYAEGLTQEDVDDCLNHIVKAHSQDPNFPTRAMALVRQYLFDESIKADPVAYAKLYEEVKIEAALVMINSPYAEVRAVVSATDDPTLPSFTIRAFVIGLIYVAGGAFINQFFSIRQPGITIYANVAQLLAYPVGKACERFLPDWSFTIPFTGGETLSLNPGPFNMKEHMVITIMANVGFSTPYTKYILWVQYPERFFNQKWAKNFGYQALISLSTNFIGYGLAGVTRRFLVYPAHAIWPNNLATIALNRAFHSDSNAVVSGWAVSRMRFFAYVFVGMFVYFWFPNYIFQALSYFNWMTWIAPQNVLLAAITGSVASTGGLGLNPIPTFDYNQITVQGDPIINPFYTTVNLFFGCLLTLPIIVALWVNNVWYTGYLPINSNGVFDNTGARYNVSLAVDDNTLFDHEAFKQYSPAYLAASNILLYGFFFAAYSSTISHSILYHRHEIWQGFKNILARKSFTADAKYDVHSRLMSKYKEVPEWHYMIVLVISIGIGAAGVGAYPTHTSPAVVLYGLLLALIFCVPVGIIRAVTNAEITLNVLAEFFGGLWFPGNANAMNFFKSYGYVTTAHTLSFAQDLKLAHYTHIPPKITFWCQMVATFLSTFVSLAVINFQMVSIPDVCAPNQPDRFTCPGANTFFTASVLWGTLGPSRMFGAGAIYNGLIWCFLIGFVLPFVFYFLNNRFPITRYFHLPVFFLGALIWAPNNLSNIWPAVPLSYAFNVFIKKRYLGWWSKYNYVMASAIACAIAISAIIQFFAVQYKSVDIDWVGNTVPYAGCDGGGKGCTYLTLEKGQHFGPGVGEFD